MVGKWTTLVWLCMHGVHGTPSLDVHSRARHRAVQNAISHWSGLELVVVAVAVGLNVSGSCVTHTWWVSGLHLCGCACTEFMAPPHSMQSHVRATALFGTQSRILVVAMVAVHAGWTEYE